MTGTPTFELPSDKRNVYRRAVRLEWVTIAYLVSALAGIYFTLGASQAMKTAFFEDLLSLVPPIAFLASGRARDRPPDRRFPYGHHRVVSIAYLVASLALFSMGAFLLTDSSIRLARLERPAIGTVAPFGEPIWLGWLMFPALAWSGIPAALIGRRKVVLARQLHDKVLLADGHMNKADWLTAGAAMLGVAGIAVGLWWADSVAAIVISLDVLHDGATNVRTVVADLMDKAPTRVEGDAADPVPSRVENELRKLSWVADARVRLREEGHVYFGEAFVVPSDQRGLLANVESAGRMIRDLDWRLHDVVVAPVAELPPSEP
ncbi:MAG: cation transporter [Actinomycetota bacterium]|nr:cation transporter [Actinomycetota bacterium]